MATATDNFTLKLQTTKDGDVEEFNFRSGDEVTIVKAWDRFFLIKDKHGHYFNVPKDKIRA